MVYYVLKDIMPFMILGTVVVFNFSIGMFVLIGRSYQYRDEDEQKTKATNSESCNGEVGKRDRFCGPPSLHVLAECSGRNDWTI